MQLKLTDINELETCYVEAASMIEICNACRYCEGFCPVYPAMTSDVLSQPRLFLKSLAFGIFVRPVG